MYRWLLSVHPGVFVSLLVVVTLVRTGARRKPWTQAMLDCVPNFPRPGDFYSCRSIVQLALPHWLGIETMAGWYVLHGLLIAGVLLGSLALLRWRVGGGASFRLGAFWLAASAVPVALLHFIGLYDVYTIAGGTVAALAPWRPLAALGGLLMGATHPEQGLVAALGLLCVAKAFGQLRSVWPAAATALLGSAATHGYASQFPLQGTSRFDRFGEALGKSLGHTVQLGNAGLYSWFNVAWLLVLGVLASPCLSRTQRLWCALGLVVLPALATVTTLDGTRVFACVSWPGFSLFVVMAVQRRHELGVRRLSALGFCLLPFLPAYTTMWSDLNAPHLRVLVRALFWL